MAVYNYDVEYLKAAYQHWRSKAASSNEGGDSSLKAARPGEKADTLTITRASLMGDTEFFAHSKNLRALRLTKAKLASFMVSDRRPSAAGACAWRRGWGAWGARARVRRAVRGRPCVSATPPPRPQRQRGRAARLNRNPLRHVVAPRRSQRARRGRPERRHAAPGLAAPAPPTAAGPVSALIASAAASAASPGRRSRLMRLRSRPPCRRAGVAAPARQDRTALDASAACAGFRRLAPACAGLRRLAPACAAWDAPTALLAQRRDSNSGPPGRAHTA